MLPASVGHAEFEELHLLEGDLGRRHGSGGPPE